ncbi:MAG TPA: SRPBCC family protein [Bryobacteraceae bacterium]|nr:SRPBCC family protein [Bryobacteraceae bacterium]
MAASSARSGALFTFAAPSDREIVMTRVFDALPALVFEAWTNPEHVIHWWGPQGCALAVCEIDLRAGGSWHFVLIGPDSKDYPFRGTYHDIAPPERLVYTQIFDIHPWSNQETLISVNFAGQNGQTLIRQTILHPTTEVRNAHISPGMKAGAAETLDRLADHLKTMV